MEKIHFDPIGFWLPICFALLFVYKAIKTTNRWDVLLLIVGIGANYSTVRITPVGLTMTFCYGWTAVLIYTFSILGLGAVVARPAVALLPYFIVSAVVPDLLGILIKAPHLHGTFGGDGLIDGVMQVPAGFTAMYLGFALFATYFAEFMKMRDVNWAKVLKYHFRPW